MDRASIFNDKKIISLLRDRFVPLTIDAWYHSRQQDAAGEFYRKVVFARKGSSPNRTTQGFYIFSPQGVLIEGWNSRDVPQALQKLRSALKEQKAKARSKEPSVTQKPQPDLKYKREVPKGGLVVDVYAKILKAKWAKSRSKWDDVVRDARGEDHLWILADERKKLQRGKITDSLRMRLARFHFMDNTRGEPPVWGRDEVKVLRMKAIKLRRGYRIEGEVKLETVDGKRGYSGVIVGFYHYKNNKLARFDLVSHGEYWGCGRYTQNPPVGRFQIGFAFRLADMSKNASRVPPQASRNLNAYLKP